MDEVSLFLPWPYAPLATVVFAVGFAVLGVKIARFLISFIPGLG